MYKILLVFWSMEELLFAFEILYISEKRGSIQERLVFKRGFNFTTMDGISEIMQKKNKQFLQII
jgi:hypothetical protein